MDRALRLLAILSLIAAVVFVVVDDVTLKPPTLNSDVRPLVTYYQITQPLLAQTSLLLAVAAGVATVTLATWRGQRAWVIGVLVALVVVVYGISVFFYYLPPNAEFDIVLALATALPFRSIYDIQIAIVPVVLPILALVYTLRPRGVSASTVAQAPADTAPSAATNRTLRLLAVIALLVALSVTLLAMYAIRNPDAASNGPVGQFLIDLAGRLWRKTSLILAFGVGVAALTDALRRRQRAWVWGLLLALLVNAYGLILFTYIVYFHNIAAVVNVLPGWLVRQYIFGNNLGDSPIPFGANVLGDVIIPALLALVVLAYSLRRPRTDFVSEGEETPSEPPSVERIAPIGSR